MKKNKLLSSGFIYTLGNLLIQSLSFITLPIFTRIMTLSEYGEFNLYMSWIAIIIIVVGLQTSGTYNIAKVKYDKNFEDYVATSITLSTISFFIVSIFVLIFNNKFVDLLGFSKVLLFFLMVHSYINYLQGSLYQYFVQKQLSFQNFSISFGASIIGVSLSILFLYFFDNKVYARIGGVLIPSSIVAILFLIYIYMKSTKLFNIRYIKFILMTSFPLIFHALGQQFLAQLDRLMIGKMLGVKEVALYSFAYSIGMVLQIVLGGLVTAWVPWLFEQKKEGNTNIIKKYQSIYISLAIFITIGYLSIFPELAKLLGSEEYTKHISLIIFIIIGYFVGYLYTFPVNIQFYNENTLYIPIGTIIATLVNFILNIVLIKKYGITGAAIATLLSYLALLIFHHIISKIKYNYNEISIVTYVISIFIVAGYGLFVYWNLDSLIIRWSMCLIILIIYVYKINLVKHIKEYIIEKRKS